MKDDSFKIGPWAFGSVATVAVAAAAILMTYFIAASPEYVSGAYVEETCVRVSVVEPDLDDGEVRYDVVCGSVRDNKVVMKQSIERAPRACASPPVESASVVSAYSDVIVVKRGAFFSLHGFGAPNETYVVEVGCMPSKTGGVVNMTFKGTSSALSSTDEDGQFLALIPIPDDAPVTWSSTMSGNGPREYFVRIMDQDGVVLKVMRRVFDVKDA